MRNRHYRDITAHMFMMLGYPVIVDGSTHYTNPEKQRMREEKKLHQETDLQSKPLKGKPFCNGERIKFHHHNDDIQQPKKIARSSSR